LFSDTDRLRRIVSSVGPLQIIYAGKAHPNDEGGKALIRRIFSEAAALRGSVEVAYLPDYDMELARVMCAGADVWLNTPQKPHEASGTSGMKAAVNGVPSLSILDGWWLEGCLEGVTGWAIGEDGGLPSDPAREAASLYEKLEHVIAPMFYQRPLAFGALMRSAVAINASFFNAQRMIVQYLRNAYLTLPTDGPDGHPDPLIPALSPYMTAPSPVEVAKSA
jgi:starch phosphorylase